MAYLRLRGDRLRLRRPDPEELRAHAVHVAHQIVAGDVGERGRELHDDVGVRDAHEVVERLSGSGLHGGGGAGEAGCPGRMVGVLQAGGEGECGSAHRHPVLFDRPGDAYVVEARVLQVVRVADADDVGEGVRPPRAVVVPGISRGGRGESGKQEVCVMAWRGVARRGVSCVSLTS